MAALGTDYNAQFSQIIRRGYAVEGPVFLLVLERCHMLIMTLALIMERTDNVFDVDNPDRNKHIFARGLQCLRPGCINMKWKDKNGIQNIESLFKMRGLSIL